MATQNPVCIVRRSARPGKGPQFCRSIVPRRANRLLPPGWQESIQRVHEMTNKVSAAATSSLIPVLFFLLPCASLSQTDRIQQVNLVRQNGQSVWKDPRGSLTSKAEELELSPEEVSRIRKNTGYVECPGYLAAKGFVGKGVATIGTGMLVGNGDVVVTDAHLFIDPATNVRREPLTECHFITLADQYSIARLDFSSEQKYKFYTVSPASEWYNDRAIVHLTQRIPDTNPLPFDLDETPLKPGDRLIMISADQEELTFTMPRRHVTYAISDNRREETDVNAEPIAQACGVMSYYARTAIASSVIYSDCNDTEKAGGSILLIRKPDGSLAAKALLTKGGNPDADYKPFKVGKGVADADLSYTLSVGLDANVYDDIMKLRRSSTPDLGGPMLADEASYQKCFDDRRSLITNLIVKQCRSDMTKRISDAGGKASDALVKEEQTCEGTAWATAGSRAAVECSGFRRQEH
jgi:hypothetical protein